MALGWDTLVVTLCEDVLMPWLGTADKQPNVVNLLQMQKKEGVVMQTNPSKKILPLWARVFAVFWTFLVWMPGGGSALADPTYTVLHNFTVTDGAYPYAGLIADSQGNLYGTTSYGGASDVGVVFKLAPDGAYTILHSFTDGGSPYAGLIADSQGNLYGTTIYGGVSGYGVVFKLAPDGAYTVLHNFTVTDGVYPYAGLIADSQGNLYGTTVYGGVPFYGVVFKLAPDGAYTVLHNFTGGTEGGYPTASLLADSQGNLYGTTGGGGSDYGVVFKLAPDGAYTVLHNFTVTDGGGPTATLIADSQGNLYGTAGYGGASGYGVVFKLAPDGAYTVLHNFTGGTDGGYPPAGLIADSQGNLYGTTGYGGASDAGVVFKLAPDGAYTVLHTFTVTDGVYPPASLIADSQGNLYGTTSYGGVSGYGVVFKLTDTGFVTAVPFSAFSVNQLVFAPKHTALSLLSQFTLGKTSDGINPIKEPVTIGLNNVTLTIPSGSFKKVLGRYAFYGNINNVYLEVVILPLRTNKFAFQLGAYGATLSGITKPVTVNLSIGNDQGTATAK